MFAKNSFNIPKQLFRQFFTRIFSNRYPCSFLSRARGPAVTWLNEAHSFLLRFLIALPRWQNKFLRLRLFAVVPSTKWNFKVNICRPLLCYDDKTKFERVVEVWKKHLMHGRTPYFLKAIILYDILTNLYENVGSMLIVTFYLTAFSEM